MSTKPLVDLPPSAFWTLWLEHQPRLRVRSLRHMHGHRSDAEEALGTTLLRAAESFARARATLRDPEAWLQRILLHACVDQHRHRSRHEGLREAGPHMTVEGRDAEPHAPSPEQEVLAREQTRLLSGHVARLPEPLKVVCRLRLERDLDGRSLARELGLSHVNTRRRLMRATQLLRRALGAPEPRRRSRGQALAC
ncbi:sigma-70 family RNA polymerase sigma factor [Myxococcus sp. K15C18031901]|uniref:RNA polymerase sigma factor n=1 Tax=Myxococcus dinghuensis TaxID=2906761 RepID=UPI0020A80E9E|nr:sigma-70 family RNA polymerase sigma factor [Myxococcus dinghuensis]MCP3097426.1 sigma-70 family RNA polymerase sigma factor [Myxococcus dinghuensis]